jgi:hypothetical protein
MIRAFVSKDGGKMFVLRQESKSAKPIYREG